MLLDRFTTMAATLRAAGDLTTGLRAPAPVLDFMNVAEAAYAADRIVARDGDWTPREFELVVPVADPERLRIAAEPTQELLRFLTGDLWQIEPASVAVGRPAPLPPVVPIDCVCLLSGGLDSLAGVIDLLCDGHRVDAISHYEGSVTPARQQELANALTARFGRTRFRRRHRTLHPVFSASPAHARALTGVGENTTRSRSLLFVAYGLVVAGAHGLECPLYVPENGFVGLNVPLTGSRLGPLSTRTTHPHTMRLLRDVLDAMTISNPVINPFSLQTKGESLASCRDPALLAELAPRSLSCSHPDQGRFDGADAIGNCGHCWPCLVRRAAMHSLGIDRAMEYHIDALQTALPGDSGAHLRALLVSLLRPAGVMDITRNGPIPAPELKQLGGLYMRGRQELATWLSAGGPHLAGRQGVIAATP
jgi:hypothetical protein